jgi:centromeric protein E
LSLGFSFRAFGNRDSEPSKYFVTGASIFLDQSYKVLVYSFFYELKCFSCQTELERERIALELEEEKKTQAEWEKRVNEQAKRIENLSSMVLFSNRDENNKYIKKVLLLHVQIKYTF